MNAHRTLSETPIAIVGLGALYPRSGDLREFWGNVVDARDCIEDVPETHWKVEDYYDPDPSAPDKTYAKRGGFIPTVPFNPLEFGLPPTTLEVTDVLQLLSLVVAKQTLADVGGGWDPARTGVVLGITGANSLTQPLATRLQTPVLKEVVRSVGLTEQDAEEIAAKFVKAFAPWEENSFPGMLGNVVAGRIANRFDFGGTNCTVDAACASSLAALHMAASELVSGRADVMLTGGCDAENTILMYLCFSKTPALSKSGVIRPFDEGSDGTLIGEGIGMLALKRLEDAERDGDRIYSVLRGIGSSSDGRFKSIYAPRREGQVVALERAYADAGVSPASVGLIECHGTGTSLGDLTELSALKDVYSAASEDKQFAAVGSVKSQIGHTKAAAGAAALIKVSLALHEKVLPPTINVTQPREAVDFPNSPFYVNTRAVPWVLEPKRDVRRAVVSSFGFGGTNFHCVVEEHSPSVTQVSHRTARVHVWHAPDVESLLEAVKGPASSERVPDSHARLAVVARDSAELASLLADAVTRIKSGVTAFELPSGAYFRTSAGVPGRVAALFAGQGSQYVGMGAATGLALPPVREAFDAASLLSDPADPLNRVVFPPPAFDKEAASAQEAALRRTDYAQPAIGALSVGQFRYLSALGFTAEGMLGHSFGELTALWAAGSLTEEEFHTLAAARGRAMASLPSADADRGTMAAVRCDAPALSDLLAEHPDVVVCNLNGPHQTVVGGGTEAVSAFVSAARAAGLDAQPLPVAAAFHTPYVMHAVDAFRAAVSSVDVREPVAEVYANTAGASYGRDIAHNREVLVDQLGKPVAFADRVRQLYEAGYRVFVEFGPRAVLSGLVRRILGEDTDAVVLSADAGPGKDGDRAIKQLVARLTVLGLPLTTPDRFTAPEPVAEETKGMRVALNGVNHVPDERRRAYQDALTNGYKITPQPAPAPAAPAPALAVSAPTPAAPTPAAAPAASAAPAAATPPPAPSAPAAAPTPSSAPQVTPAFTPQAASAPVASTPPTPAPSAPPALAEPVVSPAYHPVGFGATGVAWEHLALHRDYLDSQLRVAERLSGVLEHETRQGTLTDLAVAGITSVTEHSIAIGRSHMHATDVLLSFAHLDAGAPITYAPSSRYTPELTAAPTRYEVAAAPTPTTTPQPLTPTTVVPQWDNGDRGPEAAPTAFTPPTPTATAPAYAPSTPSAPATPTTVTTPAVTTPAPATNGTAALATNGTPAAASTAAPSINGTHAPAAVPAPATNGASAGDVQTVLLSVVEQKTGYPADMLDLSMDVEADLGIDSIKRVEIMGELRDRFPNSANATPEALGELRTLGDIIEFVGGTAAAPDPTPTAAPTPPPATQAAPATPTASPTASPAPTTAPAPATAATPAAEDVTAVLLAVVEQKTGYPADMLDLSMDVEADLGIDSIKRVEIMGELRDRFPNSANATPEALGELRTLADIVGFVGEGADLPKADGATGIARMQARLTTLPAADQLLDAYGDRPVALLSGAPTPLAERVAAALRAKGWQIGTGAPDLVLHFAPEAPQTWQDATEALTDALLTAGRHPETDHAEPSHTASNHPEPSHTAPGHTEPGHTAPGHTAPSLAPSEHRKGFIAVSRIDGRLGMADPRGPAALLGGLSGLTNTLAIEAPGLFTRTVDLSPDLSDDDAARLLLQEIEDADPVPTRIGVDARGTRHTLTLTHDTPAPTELPEPGPTDLFVVTGGARGVTAACAIGLAKRYRTNLLLLGRTPNTGVPAYLRTIPEDGLKAAIIAHTRAQGAKPLPREVEKIYKNVLAQREIQATLEAIRATGAQAEYLAVDVTDAEATKEALRPYRITGVVHGAGVLADQLIVDKKAEDVAAVLGTKLHGLKSVLDAVEEPKHVLLFSSVAGFFGNRGQSDYAMANEALNRVAVQLRADLPNSRVTSVVWGAWAGGMVTPELERMFTERGVTLIPLATGVDYFTEQFTGPRSADVVTVVGPDTPLSTREITAPTGTVRRSTAPLVGDPVLADHAIGGVPVLPATAAIGALLGSARQLKDFAVLKGVTLGDDRPEFLDFVARPDHVLVRDEGGRPRYRATVVTETPAPERIPNLDGPVTPYDPYTTGALFHGPSLRGITGVVSDVDSRLVLRCELPDAEIAGGAYRAGDYSPALADLLLQAALVRVHRAQGVNSLPTAVASVQVHGPLPSGEPFLVVVEPESGTRATITACALDGRVLLRFKGVDVVPSATLDFGQGDRR
ncbi:MULTISPECIES: SDR family NAD(P)-dependent oxidoreductase [unclassified Saccharothrix]|uniref:SDR family NAD(P)-dependent oxidoreductase n=1 Tax=unclassified Saccharothrix TaxID=2593673 RepID=UPI00307E626C